MAEKYHSPRSLAEAELDRKVQLFDKFIDLAIDGIITRDEAIKGYCEEEGVTPAPEKA